ncbi:hypothetical protein F5H01DRAFT_70360 [Linnemannia elongata]|nr:hypothetical protein F5H01DRAFT_70360 [Linnemannia elongata]
MFLPASLSLFFPSLSLPSFHPLLLPSFLPSFLPSLPPFPSLPPHSPLPFPHPLFLHSHSTHFTLAYNSQSPSPKKQQLSRIHTLTHTTSKTQTRRGQTERNPLSFLCIGLLVRVHLTASSEREQSHHHHHQQQQTFLSAPSRTSISFRIEFSTICSVEILENQKRIQANTPSRSDARSRNLLFQHE